jgi:hypothetical protein
VSLRTGNDEAICFPVSEVVQRSECIASVTSQHQGAQIMIKLFSLLSAVALAASLLCTGAEAWDNCGHGFHRNGWGHCVSNYGPTSGCPYGFHLGWNTRICRPNW